MELYAYATAVYNITCMVLRYDVGKARIYFNLFCFNQFHSLMLAVALLLVHPLDPSDYFLPCVLVANLAVSNLRPMVHVDNMPFYVSFTICISTLSDCTNRSI